MYIDPTVWSVFTHFLAFVLGVCSGMAGVYYLAKSYNKKHGL